jgi:transcriptional regulator with XRE-family HTH domain
VSRIEPPSTHELRARFGLNLREARARVDLSQEELAFRAGLNRAAVSPLEQGKTMPRIDSVIRLAGAAEVTPNNLAAGSFGRQGGHRRGRRALSCRTILTSPRRWRNRFRARLSDNLFLLRKRAGYSQLALGDRAQVFPSAIGLIENGRAMPTLATYVRLAGALGVTLDDLLAGLAWTPAVVDLDVADGYRVDLEAQASDQG